MAEQREATEDGRRVSPKLVAGAVIGVLALIFVFQNTGKGRIHFLFWTMTMPTWIWLIVLFVVGMVVGSIFPWLRPRKKG